MCPKSTTPRDILGWDTHKTNKHKKQKMLKNSTKVKQIKNKGCTPEPAQKLDGQAPHPVTEAGAGAAQKRRQGRRSTSITPGASPEEGRATRSSNPQPRTDPTSECHCIHAECRTGKMSKIPNLSSQWQTPRLRRLTSSGERRQRWRHCESHGPLQNPPQSETPQPHE